MLGEASDLNKERCAEKVRSRCLTRIKSRLAATLSQPIVTISFAVFQSWLCLPPQSIAHPLPQPVHWIFVRRALRPPRPFAGIGEEEFYTRDLMHPTSEARHCFPSFILDDASEVVHSGNSARARFAIGRVRAVSIGIAYSGVCSGAEF